MRNQSLILVILVIIVILPTGIYVYGNTNVSSQGARETVRNVDFASGDNVVGNPGFESGVFDPWVNIENSPNHYIQSSVVNTGSYALWLDTVTTSMPYPEVAQNITNGPSLADHPAFRFSVYPTGVGLTCGEFGRSSVTVFVKNLDDNLSKSIVYCWSGYNFLSLDSRTNRTMGVYTFYHIQTNAWSNIERNLYTDYVAIFGVPVNPSRFVVSYMYTFAHGSNGDPGSFGLDDVFIEAGTSTTATTTTPTGSTTTTTSSTTTEGFTLPANLAALFGSAMGAGTVIIILIVVVIIYSRRGQVVHLEYPYNRMPPHQ